MQVNLVSDRPASISVLRILAMVIVGYIVMGNVIAILTISLLYEGNLVEAMAFPLEHPEIRTIMLLAQGLASLTGSILVPWYYLQMFEHRSPKVLFGKFPSGIWVGMLAVLTIGFAISISPISEWNATMKLPDWMGAFGEYMTTMEKQAEVLVKMFTSNLTPGDFALVFVVVAILPGIGEELVFRGLIQTELQRAFGNPHAGIWVAAAFFSAFHLQFFGFFPRLLLGAFMGYVYFWSGNLWFPILTHFLNNGLQLVGLYLYQLGVHTMDMESTESAPLIVVAVSIIITTSIFYYFKKNVSLQPGISGSN